MFIFHCNCLAGSPVSSSLVASLRVEVDELTKKLASKEADVQSIVKQAASSTEAFAKCVQTFMGIST